MRAISRVLLALVALIVLIGSRADAVAVTFSTTGVFSISGTNVVNFTNVNGTTTITFNGTTDAVNTPVGVSFGDIVVTTTVPANLLGPALGGNFTLNIIQVSPAGAGSFVGTLAGTLGFNTGSAILTFSTTSITIGGITYTVDGGPYVIALPVTGVGGGAGTGTTTLQGTVTGPLSPSISKSFGTGTIAQGATTSLTFTLVNPNNANLTNVSFSDTLPSGLVVATPNGLVGSCGGGTISAVAGSGTVSLTNATLTPSGCAFSINVLGSTPGTKNNTTSTVTSNEADPGPPASATLTVLGAVPTLLPWNLVLLALLLAAMSLYLLRMRRRSTTA